MNVGANRLRGDDRSEDMECEFRGRIVRGGNGGGVVGLGGKPEDIEVQADGVGGVEWIGVVGDGPLYVEPPPINTGANTE